ncbi:hypothetical protein [Pontibacillus litoralis]|uniref:Cytosolic protein n=1 Tax=Pontibacillus litoralis JSM 072002 TaxID=1385512 RepID=A0A0A5GAP7_9BACI|nr:hypothetical protein [Pontibacillus litoralis]KGX89079.1 hypothetical protein N784_01770 [Pontibacillus litoralis JSM 072002]
MNFKQWISIYFTKHSETKENHINEELRTHYFKTTKEKAFQILKQHYEQSAHYDLLGASEEHGELCVQLKQGKQAFIVVSIIMMKPYYTAIDFSVTTESNMPIDFGFSYKVIKQQYEQLKNKLPFIETSLAHKIHV